MRRRDGFTLIEIVVCLTLFSIFMLVLTSLFSHTFRYTQAEEAPARIKQQARLTLENIANDIRKAQRVTRPANYFYLVWEDNDQIGLELQPGWTHYYELIDGKIKRHVTVVQSDVSTNAKPSTWTETMCSNAKRLRLRVEDVRSPTLITVELEVEVGRTPVVYRTRVNFRSVVQGSSS
ncbi:MAG: prepilin-type N-terminal cleavage/methylation domain-containing protein [Armatimonadetes bacterium]|nr:prepilin-type N-terminal cleavage/methylation domain-containing protein [Armatimonadota bacterium]